MRRDKGEPESETVLQKQSCARGGDTFFGVPSDTELVFIFTQWWRCASTRRRIKVKYLWSGLCLCIRMALCPCHETVADEDGLPVAIYQSPSSSFFSLSCCPPGFVTAVRLTFALLAACVAVGGLDLSVYRSCWLSERVTSSSVGRFKRKLVDCRSLLSWMVTGLCERVLARTKSVDWAVEQTGGARMEKMNGSQLDRPTKRFK